MNTAERLQQAEELLKPWTKNSYRPEENRLDVEIEPEDLVAAAQALVKQPWGYLSAITGLDYPSDGEAEGAIETLYSFCEGEAVATLRVSVPYSRPFLPTLCSLLPSATLYERELIEMFGVTVEGTPNTSHLLLPDDWPAGVYPLRKSFSGMHKAKEE